MDSILLNCLASPLFLLILAAVPLVFGYLLTRGAGVRTFGDLLVIEKAAQVILTMMNLVFAAGCGFLGMAVSLLLILFCSATTDPLPNV